MSVATAVGGATAGGGAVGTTPHASGVRRGPHVMRGGGRRWTGVMGPGLRGHLSRRPSDGLIMSGVRGATNEVTFK